MATVFFMKFNRDQGALIADEMTWHLGFKYGYRPSRYGDSIMNLLDGEKETNPGFAAVYAGVGFPSFHFEVARKAKKVLTEKPDCLGDLNKTGEVVESVYQDVHARLINDRLKFNFGFDRDELNRRKFRYDGKEVDIVQDSVISEANKILKYGVKEDIYHRIFDNDGLIMGYDQENGIRAYHLCNSGRGLEFAYPFDALGSGKELGTRLFADTFYRMQLEERRAGFRFTDGLFLLLNCFADAYDFNMKTGGYVQVFMIDAKKEVLQSITAEKHDHGAFLALEVVRAYRWGFLDKDCAQALAMSLLIGDASWEEVETRMFGNASEPDLLRKYLMGYKPVKSPDSPLSVCR
ncbi:MAG: hypothetical protein LWY06_04905 [Firmicutes bacterium]|nr:hypothetical protein [Bacillota bacterium]